MRRLALIASLILFVGLNAMFAQTTTITGTVTDSESGDPIPGVSVVVRGTTIGTVTNVDGNYSLSVPDDATNLLFSFVGMKTQDIAIGGRTTINVVMVSEAIGVDEVIVTALGISREKKALGYAVQDVKGDEITKAKETNVVNTLQGKISGAQITNTSGAVGASSRIVLRGVSSLDGNNQPLFVVDGVPIDNSNFGNTGTAGTNRGSGVQDINPDDVESMSVLKGPNAAALYGSRASNGVIVITTKSGKGTKGIGVDFNHSTTFESPLRLPDYQNKYGQGSAGKFEFVDGAGGGVNDGTDESWGPQLDVGLLIPQFDSPVDENGVRAATPWVSHPDNIKDFFETGVTSTTSVSFRKGSENASFRVSYTNMNQDGMLNNTDYKKNTVSFNGQVNLTDKFNVSASGSYIGTESDNMPGYGYDADNVMQQFVWFGRQVDLSKLKNYKNADGSWYNWNYNYHNNPYSTLNENLNTMQRERLIGNVMASYEFTPWLKAFVRSGIDYYSNWNTTRRAVGMQDYPNGFYNEQMTMHKETNTDFLVTANKKFEAFETSLSVGGNRMDYKRSWDYVEAPELAVPGVYNVKNSLVPQVADNAQYTKRINSLYFSGQLSYNSYLFLDFTGRNDWSSALPDGNNSYFYPSVTLSGIVTDMLNMNSTTMNFAKFRLGWAKVGADTDPYRLYPTLAFGDGWNASTKLLNQAVPNSLPNAELKPAFTESIEVGGEFAFFNSRLKLDLTYYNNKSTDQIIATPISPASGYTSKVINAGRIDNKGFEVSLGGTVIDSPSGLQWDVLVNWAKNTNEVVELAPGIDQYELGSYWSMKVMAIPGQKYGALYGYDFERNEDGEIIFRDGLPHQGDLKVLGNSTPDWTGGINNNFSYKGFDLSFLIDARWGGDMYSMTTTWGRYAGVLEETVIGREGGIVGDGVKELADGSFVKNDVVVSAEDFNKNAYSNDIGYSSVFDASFIKLREVRLGYTFKRIGNTAIKDVNVSVVGRNLALLYTTVPHVDPESAFGNGNVQGLEFGQIPSAKSLGFSLSFKL